MDGSIMSAHAANDISSSDARTGISTFGSPGKDFSIEITAKDVHGLEQAAPALPAGTQVSVTFLPGETEDARVAAAAAVRRLGFEPMPHLSARRLRDEAELRRYLDRLRSEAMPGRAFVVAGDLSEPAGPFTDALSLIRTGLLAEHGVRRVGVSGYPEGHPQIDDARLWAALTDKHRALREMGHEVEIVTQFGFDAEPVLTWIDQVRDAGIDAPVRIGVPGPASVQALLKFAARCGVGASAKVMAKYGASITRLLNPAGPDRLIRSLEEGLQAERHGEVRLHLYPFGGLKRLSDWLATLDDPASR